jgi:predicted HNH restriction endonuclease
VSSPKGAPRVVHIRRERSAALVQAAKTAFRKKHGRLFCEVCDFDFTQRYGTHGTTSSKPTTWSRSTRHG